MFHLLPPELRMLVYEHCELFTLTNLRSSCRILEREISALLFRTVSIDILPQGIELLRKIANRPSLACHVQTLIVSTNLLRPYSYSTFARQLCYQDCLSLQNILLPYSSWVLDMHRRSKIRRRYKRYSHYLNKQKEFLLDRASLKLTVFKLVGLKKIELRLLNDTEQSRRWHAFGYEVFGSDDNFDLRTETIHTSHDEAHLCVTYALLSEMRHHLTSLKIDYIPCSCWQFGDYEEIWRHLRHLKICVEHGSTATEICSVRVGIRKVLLNIGLIEFLHLEITPTCGYLSRIDFGELFADVQLNMIQGLRIYTGKISSHGLLKIFKLHKTNLRRFDITDLHLIDEQWETVFALLEECLQNCEVTFEGATDGDGWSIRAVVPFGHVLKVKQAASFDSTL
jgi:hypothetical protein